MKRLSIALCCLVFIAVFLWGYRAVVVPAYGYEGFTCNWPGLEIMAWVVVLILLPLLIIPLELTKPSVLVVWWLYVTAYMPAMLMPAVSLSIPPPTLIPLQFSVLCTMLMLCAVPRAKTLVLPDLVISQSIFWWTLAIVWTVSIAVLLKSIRPSKVLANYAFMLAGGSKLSEYVVRSDYFNMIGQSGRYLSYAGRELAEAFDPFLIAYGLLSKRWSIMTIGIVGQLIYVGQTGMKEVPIAILLICSIWMLRRYWRNFGFLSLLGITGLILIATAFDLSAHSERFSTLVTRRSVAGPGQLTGDYFEHYSQVAHPGHNFAGTGSFQRYGPPQEIGLYYFHNVDVDANANLWAEGFAEFGIPGIFGFALVLAASLWIYDSIAARRSFELAVLLAVVQADAISNTSPLTILVTHGGILTGMLLYFAPQLNLSQWFHVEKHGPRKHTASLPVSSSQVSGANTASRN